jgi:hypothetical protein
MCPFAIGVRVGVAAFPLEMKMFRSGVKDCGGEVVLDEWVSLDDIPTATFDPDVNNI